MINSKIGLIIFFAAKDGEAIFSQEKKKKRLAGDCGSDHELFIAKFRLKSQKVGKYIRPLGYELSQIS